MDNQFLLVPLINRKKNKIQIVRKNIIGRKSYYISKNNNKTETEIETKVETENIIINEEIEKINEIFTIHKDNLLYLASNSILYSKVNLYSEYIYERAIVFFSILDYFQLNYYVFAGAAIGLVRNGKKIPWDYDYDIIIFKEEISKFEKNILPILIKNNFYAKKPDGRNPIVIKENSNSIYSYSEWNRWNDLKYLKGNIFLKNGIYNAGFQIYSQVNQENVINTNGHFQCDIFYSYIDENNIIKNIGKWGLYHLKNVPYELVSPSKRIEFENISLPFFQNVEEDIKIEYGDVINKTIIALDHDNTVVLKGQTKENKNIHINENYQNIFKYFQNIKYHSIQNTKQIIQFDNHSYLQSCDSFQLMNALYNSYEKNIILQQLPNSSSLSKRIINSFLLLKFISNNNIKNIILKYHLHFKNEDFELLFHLQNILFYFPFIQIDLYIQDKLETIYNDSFNFIHNVFCLQIDLFKFYADNNDFFYSNKPNFMYIKFGNKNSINRIDKVIVNKYNNAITFGTFDLFHIGHQNILNKTKNICNQLIVGISSDELNLKKGKTSIQSFDIRQKKIQEIDFIHETFMEESLNKKNDYILQFDADVLTMGHDWLGKFDWVSCDVIYFERTPNISTTLLKNNLINT